jgi:dTDP-4-dehydrorhamnose reductase
LSRPIPDLLFGATSIVGFTLARRFPTLRPFVPPAAKNDWPALHLEDPTWLQTLFSTQPAQRLIYCHAVCDVSKCEENPDWAYEINVRHIQRLLEALPDTTRLIYVSSDHVFGGDGIYDEKSDTCPISVYGHTRVEAERLVLTRERSLVLRAGLPIGTSYNGRSGHSDWLEYRHRRNLPITIVEDEHRSVVWADDLANRIMQFAASDETGLRHIAATQAISRIELAQFLSQHLQIDLVYDTASRHEQPAPHLGHVELTSVYKGHLYQPLPSVLI